MYLLVVAMAITCRVVNLKWWDYCVGLLPRCVKWLPRSAMQSPPGTHSGNAKSYDPGREIPINACWIGENHFIVIFCLFLFIYFLIIIFTPQLHSCGGGM